MLLHPEVRAEEAVNLTTLAVTAEAEALEYITGYETKIKWVNDVWIREKKISGILTEGATSFEDGMMEYVVVGIGINLYEPEGGFPTVGSLFVAGEAGSELVGNINGRTGVVSNGEISGIASAIRSTSDTEVQLLRQQNVLLQGILEKEFGITDGQIFNSVRKSSREYTRSTGLYAF